MSSLERKLLSWLAHHLPQQLSPDHLTAIGFTGALIAAAGFIGSHSSMQLLWLASFGLALHWFGDSLDGAVARLRHIERPRYGFFVDHASDLFSQALIFIALGLSPCARFGIACLGLVVFLMAFVYSLICLQVRNTFRISYFGIGPTEIRALLIVGNVLTLEWGLIDVSPYLRWLAPGTHWPPVTLYEAAIVLIVALALPALAWLALGERRALALQDRAATTFAPALPGHAGVVTQR